METNIYQQSQKSFKDWFSNNIFYIMLFFVTGIWILRGLLTLEESGKTIQQIITDSALFLIFSIVISELFNFQGILNGLKTKIIVFAKQKHEEFVAKVEKYGNEVELFCERKNSENKKSVRSRILIGEGLSYKDYFNEDGSAIADKTFNYFDVPKIDKKIIWFGKEKTIQVKNKEKIRKIKAQKRAYYKALRIKLTQLTANELISEKSKQNDKFNFGERLEQFLAKSSTKGLFSQVITALIFGYYGIGLVQNFSLYALIWAIFQTMMFLIFGFWRYFKAYLYTQNGYAERINLHNQYLAECITECELKNVKTTETLVDEIAQKVANKFEVER